MIKFSAINNYCFGTALLTLILFGVIQVAISRQIRKQTRVLLIGLFAAQALCIVSNLQLQYLDNVGNLSGSAMVLVFSQSLFSGVLLLFFSGFLFTRIGIELKSSRLFLLICALTSTYTALLLSTFFTTWIYSLSPDGIYRRGPWYPLLLVPLALCLLIDIVLLLRRRKRLNVLQFISFLFVICAPLAALLLQSAFDMEPLVVYSIASAFIFLFAVFFTDQARASRRRQAELERQRANNLVLQMRPHFIYNTMMSIYYLIAQDPEKAQQVTLDFSSYLQKNFSALGKEGAIPFTEELEHTRAYLAVEQARFEDQLTVEFDTPCTAFRLPALTLQPIVENAVKHGINPEHEALHIRISTEETSKKYIISIQNNGAAFDPQKGDVFGEALGNIRERLKTTCRGDLSISSQKNATVVTVTVPKQRTRAK